MPIDGHFGQVFEIWISNLFCLIFTLTLIYKPSLKSIRPKLAVLSRKKLQKLTKVAISQNPILPKCHSPKSLLLLNFSMNLSETFRIDVNMDFAHTNHGRFLFRPQKNFEPKIQKKRFIYEVCTYMKREIFQNFQIFDSLRNAPDNILVLYVDP